MRYSANGSGKFPYCKNRSFILESISSWDIGGFQLEIQSLILEFAQALGGISKHKKDFWILEVPMAEEKTVTVFFRLNREENGEAFLVFFSQIGCYHPGDSIDMEKLLRVNMDLRFSRTAFMGERVILLAAAGENFSEDILLEMVHEVVYAGNRLQQEFGRTCADS